MNNRKAYRDSLLAALCIISWFVIVFRIFKSVKDESAVRGFILVCLGTIAIGIVGGILLLLLGILKKRKLKFSFVYNLFGTLNIIAGFLGMMLPTVQGRPSPYLVTASLAIGVVMYRTIYIRDRRIPY
jgi:membrane protease YdiL (CAAX protease family)